MLFYKEEFFYDVKETAVSDFIKNVWSQLDGRPDELFPFLIFVITPNLLTDKLGISQLSNFYF